MLGLADADNARRRANIDVENAHKFAVGKFAKSLLDVADNLGRAADSVPEEAIAENEQLKMLHEGVTMTSTMLLKTFEQHGLQRVDPLGEKFDPNLHNALFEVPDPAQEPGTIAHVQNSGTRCTTVSSAPPTSASSRNADDDRGRGRKVASSVDWRAVGVSSEKGGACDDTLEMGPSLAAGDGGFAPLDDNAIGGTSCACAVRRGRRRHHSSREAASAPSSAVDEDVALSSPAN